MMSAPNKSITFFFSYKKLSKNISRTNVFTIKTIKKNY